MVVLPGAEPMGATRPVWLVEACAWCSTDKPPEAELCGQQNRLYRMRSGPRAGARSMGEREYPS